MLRLFSEVARSFIRAFASSILILIPGVLSAPDLSASKALAAAALISGIVSGIKAVQVFVPTLSFKGVLAGTSYAAYYTWVDSFVRAFVGTFLVSVIGWLTMPNLDWSRSALTALIIGALTTAFRAIQGAGTVGDVPGPQSGLSLPGSGE